MAARRDLLVAFAFLTRLPVRASSFWQKDDLAASVVMFPLVGAAVGLIGALAYGAAAGLDFPPLLAATITLAVMILATGGLHEDGLADVADGFGGGRTREDKLRIMRDSRLGSYGAITLVLALVTRIAALAALGAWSTVASALVAAAALSRAALPLAMVTMSQARAEGLAASTGRPHSGRAAAAGLIGVLVALLCLPWGQAVGAVLVAAVAGGLVLALARRQIGGITGDVLGALQQVVEIAVLLTLASLAAGQSAS